MFDEQLSITRNLPDSAATSYDAFLAHYKAQSNTDDHIKRTQSIVSDCYGHLSIIDNKANALLAFNGLILVVIASFIFPYARGAADQIASGVFVFVASPSSVLMLLAITALSVSIVNCLSVVMLYWISGRVFDASASQRERDADKKATREDLLSRLCHIVVKRTMRLRLAWWMSLIGYGLATFSFVSLFLQ